MTSVRSQSPGRINIIGEHTDYNEGFVLPAAIDKKSVFTIKNNGSEHIVKVKASNLGETFSFDLRAFQPVDQGWPNYILGVVSELQALEANLSGFYAEFSSDVPVGAGMSSSAALECSLAYGLNEFFGLGLDRWQLIKACQKAEHNFAGTKCGIMDQFASVMGKKGHAMLLDCHSLTFEYFPLDLGKYRLLLLDTNVSHTLASSGYNTRREECERAVAMFKKRFHKVENLRDVSMDMLQQLRGKLPEVLFKRCFHVIRENHRVLEATRALSEGNVKLLGDLMYQSHFSLQNLYEVSCPELDFLVQMTLDTDHILGSRMMGGGFGGCTINIIDNQFVDKVVEQLSTDYRNKFGINLTPYSVSSEDGASLVS